MFMGLKIEIMANYRLFRIIEFVTQVIVDQSYAFLVRLDKRCLYLTFCKFTNIFIEIFSLSFNNILTKAMLK